MLKNPIIILVFLLGTIGIQAQVASLECLVVQDQDGAVSLRFSGSSNATAFEIYRADQLNGIYDRIHTTSSGIFTTYLDEEINAASQSYAYYVQAIVGGQGTGASNKMRTILLNAVNLLNGQVDLNWNDPGTNPTADYEIYVKGSLNVFQLLTNTPNESYVDTLTECSTTNFYQIRVFTSGCESISSVRGGSYGDYTAPEIVIPKNATVDTATGEIVLSWLLPSPIDADISKYQIWMLNSEGGTTTFPFAEVHGYHNLTVRLNYDQVCDTIVAFAVSAIDSCGNSRGWSDDFLIRTMNMHAPIYDICNDACEISWDSVYAWHDMDVEGIRIYRQEENNPFEIMTEVAPTEKSVLTYGFERGVKYQFYIEAYSQNDTRKTTSCIKEIIGKKPITTKYTWLRSASVINGEVHLKWQVDSMAYIPYYAIAWSEDGVNYDIIDTIVGSSDTVHTAIDIRSKYYKSPQYYQVHPFDSCLNMGNPSNHAVTIYTKVQSYSDGHALIEWTPYETMSDLVVYNVYRIIDSLVYPFPIAEIMPNSELSYIDDYALSVPLSAKVGYLVEALGRVVDSLYMEDTARSNDNFLTKASNLFVPSGFRPQGGVTEIFKPIYTGVKLRNYSFKVLNRWGQMIFETHQPVLGWDGTFQKEYVVPGAYVYIIDYETIYGKRKQKSGMFMVL